tara:strand:+ start:337 stop:669 length:333 start_codon:yes stop_codon:yes gene_type:complete
MSMRDQISQVARSLRYSSNNADQLADAILEDLPNMIAPLVWSKDVEYFSYATTQTGQYQVREAEIGWYVQLDCYRSILVAEQLESREQGKAAANTHYRATTMVVFTGETQ